MGVKGLRNAAIISFVLSMAALLVGGYLCHRQGAANSLDSLFRHARNLGPELILTSSQIVWIDHASIMRGQDVYQRYGLMDHGSVWGHGTLRGMDFSADTLHRIGQHMRDFMASGDQPQAALTRNCPPSVNGQSMPR